MPTYSRLGRTEEKKARKRIQIAILGSIAILVFVALFGLKLLVGFSVLVDKARGGTAQPTPSQGVILPPTLDALPDATNSATLIISGKATPKLQVIVYLNASEYQRATVADDGTFSMHDVPVDEGQVSVSAKLTDDKNNVSELSNVITTTVDRKPPKLTVDKPSDNATVNDGTHRVLVEGLTDDDARVTVNGRIVVTRSDNTFSYQMSINDGKNDLAIVATDAAGNQTKVDRSVTYQP
jgi:hypothetical protein